MTSPGNAVITGSSSNGGGGNF
jgi:protein-tyrosine phosphatase